MKSGVTSKTQIIAVAFIVIAGTPYEIYAKDRGETKENVSKNEDKEDESKKHEAYIHDGFLFSIYSGIGYTYLIRKEILECQIGPCNEIQEKIEEWDFATNNLALTVGISLDDFVALIFEAQLSMLSVKENKYKGGRALAYGGLGARFFLPYNLSSQIAVLFGFPVFFSMSGSLSKEWWVSDNWAIGLGIMVNVGLVHMDSADEVYSVQTHLGFTATYN